MADQLEIEAATTTTTTTNIDNMPLDELFTPWEL
jgi:hypothetical protein